MEQKSNWFSAHTHSNFSSLDGMTPVESIVAKVAKMGQPALALTDHGNMANVVQLYLSAKKHNIISFAGVEAYLLDPDTTIEDITPSEDKAVNKAKRVPDRFHIGLLALDLEGYQALIKAVSLSHTRPRFNRFPRFLLSDLAELAEEAGEHIAVTTGCYFGFVQQTLVNENAKKAENIIKMYANWFPNTFVEVQNHSIVHDQDNERNPLTDEDIVAELVGMADRLGLPILATQDSHYLNGKDKKAHSLMKRMVYGGKDDEFPGDSFHIASADWMKEHYDKKTWAKVEEGSKQLLELNDFHLPPLDKYKAQIPSLVKNPYKEVATKCVTALEEMPIKSANKRKAYEERLQYELDVIKDLGMAGYFMLVWDYVQWCNQKKICIEARGSANGSLVCYLLGITQVDPIKWNLIFDRFLSRDRIKPPDIDMDIEDTSRDRVVNYLEKHFDTVRIGTWSKLGVNEEGKGSVLVSYKSYITKKPENKGKEKMLYATLQTIEDVKRFNKDDYEGLQLISEMGGVYRSYGVHAGGILISGKDQQIDSFVPKMLVASSNTEVSQFDMDDVEKLGFLKLDILGQTTLTVMRDCQEYIGRENPNDFSWIPEDDESACKILREGRMDNGIFHFEGYTKAKGGKNMGIKSVKDAILATGLFMPGAMNTGQTQMYLERRKSVDARSSVKYIHPIWEANLKDTYGAVIFQEQVIGIMRGLGMSVEGVNTFFSIVKSSGAGAVGENMIKLEKMRKEFDELCIKAGITKPKDIQTAWDSTAGFVSYGFNRAHATGYGLRSYRCAYLKAHYPLEFMSALLKSWAGTDKEILYVREARTIGVRILPPDINISKASWTLDRNAKAIRRGLVSIKGVGVTASEVIEQNAPYKDMADLLARSSGRTVTGGKTYLKDGKMTGTLLKLFEAGALDSLIKAQKHNDKYQELIRKDPPPF